MKVGINLNMREHKKKIVDNNISEGWNILFILTFSFASFVFIIIIIIILA